MTALYLSLSTVAFGLICLAIGGDMLVKSSLSVARRLKISPLLTGIIVVGFGTSMPELLVSLDAAFRGYPDIAVGNVVGSNIANIFLILGVAGIIAPISFSVKQLRLDIVAAVFAGILLLGLGYYGTITRPVGVVMVILMAVYIIYTIRKDGANEPQPDEGASSYLPKQVLMVLLSAAILAFGANLLVEGAGDIARRMGVSDAIIGLTLVAIGTSLPELAASVMAAIRKQTDVIIGNVLGSTLFNIMVILGLTAIVTPLSIAPRLLSIDIPISIIAVILVGMLAIFFGKIKAAQGVFFMSLYSGYIIWLFA